MLVLATNLEPELWLLAVVLQLNFFGLVLSLEAWRIVSWWRCAEKSSSKGWGTIVQLLVILSLLRWVQEAYIVART